jgi:glycosyltransferase involved in cell wall biosynthesis
VRIAVYVALNRLAIPSGVPRHIREVVSGLLKDARFDVQLLVNREQAATYLPREAGEWQAANCVLFDQPVSRMQRLWGLLERPSFEELGGRADWVYLPADGYVPTRKGKLAVTIHDVYKLEKPAPGESRSGHYYGRLRHAVVYARVAQRADLILTVSEFSAERIGHFLRIPPDRIRVVYNGIAEEFFQPDERLWPGLQKRLGLEDEEYVVYMGGLKAKKNAAGIIESWSLIEARARMVRLVVLGHHDMAALSQAQGALRQAIFPAPMSDAELAILLRHSRALLFPSHYEGFGIPVAEAMAAGTALVLADIPALRELAGDLPFYGDPRRAESLADAIEACLDSHAKREEKVARGRERARVYTWSACVQRVATALREGGE